MTALTKLSEKGQVVVPKASRERLGWQPGVDLSVVDLADGILLRRRDTHQSKLSPAEAVARWRSLYRHNGPPIPVEQLSWSPTVDDDEL